MGNRPKVAAGIGVMVLKHGKVLLGKRHHDPEKADSALHGESTWTMPGGTLEFGESFEECAERELMEETGIKANALQVVSLANDKVKDAHFVTVGLLCVDFEGEPSVQEPDEITEWKWFAIDKIPKNLFFPSEKVLKNYLDKSFYKH